MKKIIFVADSLEFGGVENTLISWIKFLSKNNNFEITLLLLRKKGELIKEIPQNVKVITVNIEIQKKLEPIRNKFSENLKKKNWKYFLNLFKEILYIKFKYIFLKNIEIGELIRYEAVNQAKSIEEKYDIAIAYSDHSSMYFVKNKINANRKILWIHADYDKVKRKVKPLIKEYNSFDKIVCVSKTIRNNFIKKFKNFEEKTFILNNILDKERIDSLKNNKVSEFSEKYINILSVGRLEKEKNFQELIMGFNLMNDEAKEKSRLYIIGDGKERKKLQKIIEDNNLIDKVFLLGAKSNPYSYMNKCDLYIQPSLYEGFCTTVNEAKYLRKPIIVTNVGGMDELLKNEKTGIIINKKDKKTIKVYMQEMILNEERRKKLKDNLKNENDMKIKEKYLELLK